MTLAIPSKQVLAKSRCSSAVHERRFVFIADGFKVSIRAEQGEVVHKSHFEPRGLIRGRPSFRWHSASRRLACTRTTTSHASFQSLAVDGLKGLGPPFPPRAPVRKGFQRE